MISNFLHSIRVSCIKFDGEDFAKEAFTFGRYGSDHEHIPEKYTSYTFRKFFEELANGKTFPKYVMNRRFDFEICGISRICLAQLTRDSAIYCSESHGLRPLDFELVLPSSLLNDKDVMDEYEKAIKHIQKAYIIACEHEIPYPESRYIGPHSQTISVCASFTLGDFIRCCHSRTNNSFCDELNLVYRFMFIELQDKIESVKDDNSKALWRLYINKKNCIDDSFYTRTKVFNGDFNFTEINKHNYEEPAINDWRKSGWKNDLEYIYEHANIILTEKERKIIQEWMSYENEGLKLPTSYDSSAKRVAKNAIKNTDYYKEYRDDN